MAIYEGSRHETSLVRRVKDAKGTVRPTVFADPRRLETDFRYRFYTTIEGDRIDSLAYMFYGSSEYWWFIANVNPEVLYWDELSGGTVLRIPQL